MTSPEDEDAAAEEQLAELMAEDQANGADRGADGEGTDLNANELFRKLFTRRRNLPVGPEWQ